jgi:hypothetical protein
MHAGRQVGSSPSSRLVGRKAASHSSGVRGGAPLPVDIAVLAVLAGTVRTTRALRPHCGPRALPAQRAGHEKRQRAAENPHAAVRRSRGGWKTLNAAGTAVKRMGYKSTSTVLGIPSRAEPGMMGQLN